MNKNGYSTSVQVKFNNEKEHEILEKISRQPNKNAYIKLLIYKDIEESKNEYKIDKRTVEEIQNIIKESEEEIEEVTSQYSKECAKLRAYDKIIELIK